MRPVVFIHLCFCTDAVDAQMHRCTDVQYPPLKAPAGCQNVYSVVICWLVLPQIVQETNGSKHVFNLSHMICSETIFCSYTHTHRHIRTLPHTVPWMNRKRQIWNTQQCQCVHHTHARTHIHTQPRTQGYGKVVQCVEPQRSWWMYHHPMVKSSKWYITGSTRNTCSLHWCS